MIPRFLWDSYDRRLLKLIYYAMRTFLNKTSYLKNDLKFIVRNFVEKNDELQNMKLEGSSKTYYDKLMIIDCKTN
jgi:hypothetical protein